MKHCGITHAVFVPEMEKERAFTSPVLVPLTIEPFESKVV
jgi:hypothetical protein